MRSLINTRVFAARLLIVRKSLTDSRDMAIVRRYIDELEAIAREQQDEQSRKTAQLASAEISETYLAASRM